jgi:hypothetical protein
MRTRLTVVLPFVLIVAAAISWAAAPGAAQQQLNCTIHEPQPAHPLEMNTVVSDPRTSQFREPLIKHVIMEKDVWDCVENEGTPEERRFTRDVETFIEIVQRVQGGRTTTLEKRVEEITCDKGNSTTRVFGVSCSARDVPVEQTPPRFPCSPINPQFRAQPTDPVEMNTVLTARQDTVKTMKVDKEIVVCDLGVPAFFQGELYEGVSEPTYKRSLQLLSVPEVGELLGMGRS